MERLGLFYVRFMDDLVVLAPTRWKLRRAVKVVNEDLHGLHLEKHPSKAFIGRIKNGVDFLDYRFGPAGLTVAGETIRKFVEPAARLYKQEQGDPSMVSRVGGYLRRWAYWANAGVYGAR